MEWSFQMLKENDKCYSLNGLFSFTFLKQHRYCIRSVNYSLGFERFIGTQIWLRWYWKRNLQMLGNFFLSLQLFDRDPSTTVWSVLRQTDHGSNSLYHWPWPPSRPLRGPFTWSKTVGINRNIILRVSHAAYLNVKHYIHVHVFAHGREWRPRSCNWINSSPVVQYNPIQSNFPKVNFQEWQTEVWNCLIPTVKRV